jgi:hypothetical protein
MMPNSRGGTGLSINDAGFTQRYIMALFYYAMDGDNWVQKQGWLSEKSECEWFGIDGISEGCGADGIGGCIKRSDFKGDFNKVCRLSMGRLNNLFGEFPKELGQLTEMRYVEIQDDWLVGTIPSELGEGWRKLHTFLIGGNVMSGVFPTSFADNEFLGTVFIDRNNFNGTFPTVFDTLKNLEWLDAEGNAFTGSLSPGIGELKNLSESSSCVDGIFCFCCDACGSKRQSTDSITFYHFTLQGFSISITTASVENFPIHSTNLT